jgi:predicted Ser/Thr protein kinase
MGNLRSRTNAKGNKLYVNLKTSVRNQLTASCNLQTAKPESVTLHSIRDVLSRIDRNQSRKLQYIDEKNVYNARGYKDCGG